MSISSISTSTRIALWARAAGRCQYEGCNQLLSIDRLTKTFMNSAYIAHIVADKPDGPRGDLTDSTRLCRDLSNLMLACDVHHRLIDIEQVAEHPVSRLLAMKRKHEERIELLSSLVPERQSHILLYGANIGQQYPALSFQRAAWAMLPDWYPADSRAIEVGLRNSGVTDRNPAYWAWEELSLVNHVNQQLRPRLAQGEVQHLSIFALAPQPLLIQLGALLSDIPACEVYQLHREPAGWAWDDSAEPVPYRVAEPSSNDGPPALIFSLSGTVLDERITAVLPGASIWRISVDSPHNDLVRSRQDTRAFRRCLRATLDRIKAAHGQADSIHIFPAMPVSLAVEVGRVRMPKADLRFTIYDEDRDAGGFRPALEIGT